MRYLVEKKKVSKRTTKKKVSNNILKKVPVEISFYFKDGTNCQDVLSLAEKIESMAEEHFQNHVNEGKNDFAQWIEIVFKEPELANELRKTQNKDRHVIEILKHLLKRV